MWRETDAVQPLAKHGWCWNREMLGTAYIFWKNIMAAKVLASRITSYSIVCVGWSGWWFPSGRISATCATVYPKKYAHGFCFAVLCCGYTLTDFPISIRLTSLALGQSNDCPSASKETLMNMDKYFMWIHYERLYNHNKAKHNKTVCIFLGIYCICVRAIIEMSMHNSTNKCSKQRVDSLVAGVCYWFRLTGCWN